MILFVLLAAGPCDATLANARAAFDRQQWQDAVAAFREAVTACPPKAEIHVGLAQVLFVAGKPDEAEKHLRTALELDPKHVPALYSLGRVYYEQHRFSESVDLLERTVAADPGHYRGWDNLGLAYDALRRDDAALRAFFKALDLVMKDHPDYDWAHANLADFFLKRDQHEKAFQLAAEAARRNPRSARNAFLTGKALARLRKPDLSVRWLEQSVKLDADYAEAWYLLAQQYKKLDRAADAERALERFKVANQARPQRR